MTREDLIEAILLERRQGTKPGRIHGKLARSKPPFVSWEYWMQQHKPSPGQSALPPANYYSPSARAKRAKKAKKG